MAEIGFSQQVVQEILSTVTATACIVLNGDDSSYKVTAGSLSPEGFDKIVELINHYWSMSLNEDVNRYAGFIIDDQLLILFVKNLPIGKHRLGLVFQGGTSFHSMHQAMVSFVEKLITTEKFGTDPEQGLEYFLHSSSKPEPLIEKSINQNPSGWFRLNEFIEGHEGTTLSENELQQSKNFTEEADKCSQKSKNKHTCLDENWLDVEVILEGASNQENEVGGLNAERNNQGVDIGMIEKASSSESSDLLENRKMNIWGSLQEVPQQSEDLVSIFQDEFKLRDTSSGLNEWMISSESDDACVAPTDTDAEIASIEEVFSMATFSLEPYLKEHFLLGEIRRDLYSWLTAVCDQYCWQLDYLSIRPTRLKWRLCDFPESLIQEMFQIIRERTTERLFRVFPELQKNNITGDFWSASYNMGTEGFHISK